MPYKPRTPALIAAPNVVPMADIMLVLLIIFMVITPLMRPESLVRMAKAKNADKMPYAGRDDAIVVAVTRNGNFFLTPGNREIGLNTLGSDVKESSLAGRTGPYTSVRTLARNIKTSSAR
jgi:biopolymer transport protein TolR